LDFSPANRDGKIFGKVNFTAVTTGSVASFVETADEVYGEDLRWSGDGCGFYGGDFEAFPVYLGGEIDFVNVEVYWLGGLFYLS